MSEIVISTYSDGILVVDSRLIALELGIKHSDWYQNILKKYQKEAEQAFSLLRDGTSTETTIGRPEKFVFLTEEQATFYMTLSRNTPDVVNLKVELVKKFFQARQLLQQAGIPKPSNTATYINRLQNMSAHEVPYDVWTTFREGAEVLLLVEVKYKVPVGKLDLCDGSIGEHWRQYRIEIGITNPIKTYTHRFPDYRPDVYPNAYEYSELPIFRKWLSEVYVPLHLPKYLLDKYGKRAIKQIYEEQGIILNQSIQDLMEEKRITSKQDELYQIFLAARDSLMNSSRYLPSNPTINY